MGQDATEVREMSEPQSEDQVFGRSLPAFPMNCKIHWQCQGLSKRELLAAMVLQGMAAYYGQTMQPENMVYGAVRRADALLKELAK